MDVSFKCTDAELAQAEKIAERALAIYRRIGHKRSKQEILMDLLATHANGCPMDFDRLAEADDLNLIHDVGGVYQHLNRATGQLTDCFLPRFHLRGQQLSDHDPAIMHKSVMKKLGRSSGKI